MYLCMQRMCLPSIISRYVQQSTPLAAIRSVTRTRPVHSPSPGTSSRREIHRAPSPLLSEPLGDCAVHEQAPFHSKQPAKQENSARPHRLNHPLPPAERV